MPETTQLKSRPLLPSLKKNHGIQPPDAGKWDARKADELDTISEGLDVNQAETQVNSIPDVWARPLLFEMALFSSDKKDKKHPLRDQIVGEWRGLLAILALRDVKKLNILTAAKVEIQNQEKKENLNDTQPDDTESKAEQNNIFLKALDSLIPTKSLTLDTTWRHLYLFLFKIGHQTRPIGMTSPTTLVVTSTHYFNHIDQSKVPWFDGKILQDPINFLSKVEKEAVAGWIDKLIENLINHSQAKDELIWEKLSGLLNKFITDLNVTSKYSEGNSISIEKASGVFYYFDKPAAEIISSESEVSLFSSVERNPLKPMLLVDSEIATQWGVKPKDISVWGSATLADLPANGVIKRNQIGNHIINDAELWQTKELFTEKLFVVQSENAFSGASQPSWLGSPPQINNQPISIILPIVRELLKYIDEESLLQKLKFQQGANGEITVQLNLELGEQKRSYTAKKTYSREEIYDFDQVPILEVFPNFKNKNWKAYYVAYSADNPKITFQVKPYSSYTVDKESDVSDGNSSQTEKDWKFEPSVEEAKIPIKNNPNGERRIWRLESFPNVLVCKARDENGNEQEAGLLLLNSPSEELKYGNKTFTVGVDFGASGTSVFYNSSDIDPKPLKFENRKISVTDLKGKEKSQLFDFFFPPRDFEIPVLSIFQDFNNPTAGNYLPVTDGHIYYVEDKKLPENIFTNLKWSDETQHNLYAEAFLTQICLQTVAELVQVGVSTINWKFSYPSSFSEAHLGKFEASWNEIPKRTEELTGVKSASFSQVTESIAAAQFFRSPPTNAQIEEGTVFIDIGSSTSDVSVWQNGNLLWQISLRYAGQDIFLDYLQTNQTILNQLGISQVDTEHFYAQIDAVLRQDSETIFANLARGGFEDLKQHLALGLCGLFYYVGLGINCLRQNNFYSKPQMPHFYFAGNGSKMFRWLVNGQTWGNNRLTELYKSLFESVFTKALDEKLNGFFELEMSKYPKKEAAFGLVCDITLKDKEKCKKVFAGENFIENKTQYQWSESLDKERLTDSLQVPAELEKLSEFIEQFNDFAANSEGLLKKYACDDRRLSSVRGKVANDLADLARQSDDQVVVQPIFILALKHLLKD